MTQNFEFVAGVKKVSTMAAKGGSIIVTLEMDLSDELALLAATQNKTCSVKLAFDNEAVEIAKQQQAKKELESTGQAPLDFDQ